MRVERPAVSFRCGRSPGGSLPVLEGGIMRTRSTLLAIGMMALGGLLGYAAASGQFTAL
jgi:hypothetical protein